MPSLRTCCAVLCCAMLCCAVVLRNAVPPQTMLGTAPCSFRHTWCTLLTPEPGSHLPRRSPRVSSTSA